MARVAGLPVETVGRLRCPATRRWADEVLAETARSAAAGADLGDLLHDLVGEEPEPVGDGSAADITATTERRRLLRLRREVFNNRLPRDPDADLALVTARSPHVGSLLAEWLADRARLTAREAEGTVLMAEELARTRAELRGIAREDRLRKGVLLASPTLDAQLDAFVRSDPARPDKRARKAERSLLSYLYRTACKTSPFSTFTGVSLGEFTDPATPGPHPRTLDLDGADGGEWTSHPRLNVLALDRVADAVLADPARRADLPVALASGWGRDADRVRYVRRWVTAGDDDTAVTFDTVTDRLFFLRRSGTLEKMLRLFEERPELRYGELASWLAAEEGASADEVEQYLSALLGLGMVQTPTLRTGVHDTDPLRAFADALTELGSDWARETAEALRGPIRCLAEFPGAGPARRRELLAELRDGLRAVQEGLGEKEPRVPQTTMYEDSVGPDVRTPYPAWSPLLGGPLRAVEGVLPAFDVTLPQRFTLLGFFLARFGRGGRCTDLLKLVHDFHEDLFDQYISMTSRRVPFDDQGRYVPEENWLGQRRLRQLDAARALFADRMKELWARDGEAEEIALDAGLLAEVADELGDASPPFSLYSHHLQLVEPGGGEAPSLVLNRSYGGLSFPFSRFAHCYDGAEAPLADRLRDQARELQPEGAVFAEVTGGSVTSNLNLHGRLTDHEIVCPGETSSVPEEYRIPLEDLVLEHDVEQDRLVLRSQRLGREVVPVYLGYLVPLALPEIPRTLLLLSPTSMARVDPWGGVPVSAAVDGVTRRPRVRHGAVVLSRRSWSAPAAVLPLRTADATDAAWFLGWQRWRERHRLPARVFATVSGGGARGGTAAKPQYLDLDSALSLTAFEALLKNADATVTFREMLPDESDLHAVSGRGRHVAELAVETVGRTRPAPGATAPAAAAATDTAGGDR
ncbi:lantibiotic dehydratase [Streptomyces spiramenti]|uniref:Lantibiotic dehydratase n=1 Tax=Streptomyces spiramenti TaxID=2720606 RepID=A0ABX1AMT7_9ACTN|nr:lantibiotic dehydratase [Streptomyces spiramenti]NJP66966.1 lantibiotic dehydratase [Streptomyces spiramenti]